MHRNRYGVRRQENRPQERFEATAGFEPAIRVLQTPALPLGYVATLPRGNVPPIYASRGAPNCQMLPPDVSCTPERRIQDGSTTFPRYRHERPDDPLRTVRRHLSVDHRRPTERNGPAQDASPVHGLRVPVVRPGESKGAGQVVQRAQEIRLHHAALRAGPLRSPLQLHRCRPPASGRSGRILGRAGRERARSRGSPSAFPTSKSRVAPKLFRSIWGLRLRLPVSANRINQRTKKTVVGCRDDGPAETFAHRALQRRRRRARHP